MRQLLLVTAVVLALLISIKAAPIGNQLNAKTTESSGNLQRERLIIDDSTEEGSDEAIMAASGTLGDFQLVGNLRPYDLSDKDSGMQISKMHVKVHGLEMDDKAKVEDVEQLFTKINDYLVCTYEKKEGCDEKLQATKGNTLGIYKESKPRTSQSHVPWWANNRRHSHYPRKYSTLHDEPLEGVRFKLPLQSGHHSLKSPWGFQRRHPHSFSSGSHATPYARHNSFHHTPSGGYSFMPTRPHSLLLSDTDSYALKSPSSTYEPYSHALMGTSPMQGRHHFNGPHSWNDAQLQPHHSRHTFGPSHKFGGFSDKDHSRFGNIWGSLRNHKRIRGADTSQDSTEHSYDHGHQETDDDDERDEDVVSFTKWSLRGKQKKTDSNSSKRNRLRWDH